MPLTSVTMDTGYFLFTEVLLDNSTSFIGKFVYNVRVMTIMNAKAVKRLNTMILPNFLQIRNIASHRLPIFIPQIRCPHSLNILGS